VSIKIFDESYKHAGHAAMRNKAAVETHFRVEVVSPLFQGKVRLVCSLVYALTKFECALLRVAGANIHINHCSHCLPDTV
jgi:hypothetical protein